MRKPRPIVVIDTSVFISDALSRTQAGAASQVLAILPAVATIIMCEAIREEEFIVTGNPRHLKPGTNYAGFLFVTPHDLLVKMQDW